MKVAVLGKGFVSQHLPYKKILDRVEPDFDSIERIVFRSGADVIVNCLGKTGRPNIDAIESQKDEAHTANTIIPLMLAEWCGKHSVRLVQMSSGCIFYGQSPNVTEEFGKTEYIDHGWKETDFANPESYYSRTKYATDLLLEKHNHVSLLRLRMPISTMNDPRNLINKLINYKQVIDIPNSMTVMSDLVRCVDWVIDNEKSGIYHVANPEPITAAQVMNEYKKYVPSHTFEIITESQLDNLTVAKRSNCLLDTSKLKNEGFQMTPSKEALKQTIKQFIENKNATL